jgi:16S rRNA (guanine527-N7)-methyltransferase
MDLFREFLRKCGVSDERVGDLSTLTRLREDLVEANRATNLTRIVDEDGFWWRHVADSLSVGLVMPALLREPLAVADVGCGAGFPMLPLAWANPRLRVTGIESRGKKARFVQEQIDRMGLEHCETVAMRAREAARLPEHQGRYDAVLVRAVGAAGPMVRECRRLLGASASSAMVFYKTPDAVAVEREAARREAGKFALEVAESEVLSLPESVGVRQFMLVRRPG